MSGGPQSTGERSAVEQTSVIFFGKPDLPWIGRLSMAGYSLSSYTDAGRFWERLSLGGDLILVDFAQSGTGPLCERLRDPENSRMPVVGIAEGDTARSRMKALKAGCDAVLAAPVDEGELIALLRAQLRHSRCQQRMIDGLREASRSRADLTDFLIHDLKNPLATILTNLHLVKQQVSTDIGKRLVDEGKAAGRRLERMLTNWLDISHQDAGRLRVDRLVVRLDDLVEEAVVAVRPLGAPRAIEVGAELGDLASQTVEVDFDMMTRVLVNLLENAVRHTPAGGAVAVRAIPDGKTMRLCVDDSGRGVPEEERGRIFQRFVRLNTEVQRREGHGLGLAFARTVAEAHGLEIGVASGPCGGGRFFLRFPIT